MFTHTHIDIEGVGGGREMEFGEKAFMKAPTEM